MFVILAVLPTVSAIVLAIDILGDRVSLAAWVARGKARLAARDAAPATVWPEELARTA